MGQQSLSSFNNNVVQEPNINASTKGIVGFCEDEIKESLLWYGKYVQEGRRFVDTFNNHVYTMEQVSDNRRKFTLQPCSTLEPISGEFRDPSLDENYTDNICSLSGAMDLGSLIPLPNGDVFDDPDSNKEYISLGEIVLEVEELEKPIASIFNIFDTPKGDPEYVLEQVKKTIENKSFNDITVYGPTGYTRPDPDSTEDKNDELSVLERLESNVRTAIIETTQYSKWTFEDNNIRKWVESHFEPGMTILNACAGKTRLTPPENGEIIRNDINPDRDADMHMDVAEIASHPDLAKESIDLVIFDPPWSAYQSNLRYENHHVYTKTIDNDDLPVNNVEVNLKELPFETPNPEEKEQLGHARLAKEGFDYLLKGNGKVLQLTFHTTNLPARLGYEQGQRVIFNPIGEAKCVLGSVDKKVRTGITDFS